MTVKPVKITDDEIKAVLPEGFTLPAGFAVVKVNHCRTCDEYWIGKVQVKIDEEGDPVIVRDKPRTCANQDCRSPYWDRERTRGVKEDQKTSSKKSREKS